MRQLTDTEAAYWAGIFDADGHIDVHGDYRTSISLGMISRDFMLDYLSLFEGSPGARLYLRTETPLPHGKPMWVVHLTRSKDQYQFLVQLLPYLRLKSAGAARVIYRLQNKPRATLE